MTEPDPKADLHSYLQEARDALVWKLDGLSEYDIRRPMVPTGTNLLGVVKHVASVELGYLGDVFGRPSRVPLPWLAKGAEPNADMWATPDQSRVPWWGKHGEVTLHKILVHMIAETHRHAGHADIVRELIDGSAGVSQEYDNLPPGDQAWWQGYRARLEDAAREAAQR
jgi:hypothetical protein